MNQGRAIIHYLCYIEQFARSFYFESWNSVVSLKLCWVHLQLCPGICWSKIFILLRLKYKPVMIHLMRFNGIFCLFLMFFLTYFVLIISLKVQFEYFVSYKKVCHVCISHTNIQLPLFHFIKNVQHFRRPGRLKHSYLTLMNGPSVLCQL